MPPRNGNEFFPKTTYLSFDTGNTTAILGEALGEGGCKVCSKDHIKQRSFECLAQSQYIILCFGKIVVESVQYKSTLCLVNFQNITAFKYCVESVFFPSAQVVMVTRVFDRQAEGVQCYDGG